MSTSSTSAASKSQSQVALDYAATTSLSSGISEGWLLGDSRSTVLRILLKRSVRDLDSNKIRSFLHEFELDTTGDTWRSSGFPSELIGAAAFSPSPSGDKLAIMREAAAEGGNDKGSKSYVIEVWSSGDPSGSGRGLMQRIPTGKLHDKVMAEGWFGGFEWSPCESRVVYVAQKPAPKTRSHFSSPPPANGGAAAEGGEPGGQFDYREDWGEKYEGVCELGLYIADFNSGRVAAVTGIDAGLTPGQPQWALRETCLVYTAWACAPRKLGMIYCHQRPCKLYGADVSELLEAIAKQQDGDGGGDLPQARHTCLTPDDALAQSPRVAPGGARIVWLSRREGFETHSGALRLIAGTLTADLSASGGGSGSGVALRDVKTLVDVVAAPPSPRVFPGLWLSELPRRCWSRDGTALHTGTMWGSVAAAVAVDAAGSSSSGCGGGGGGGGSSVTRTLDADNAATVAGAGGGSGGGGSEGGLEGGEGWSASDGAAHASVDVLSAGRTGGEVLVAASAPNAPGGFAVVLGDGRVVRGAALGTACITSGIRVPPAAVTAAQQALRDVTWQLLSLTPPRAGHRFEAFLMKPPTGAPWPGGRQGEGGGRPLLVLPHGGPHACMPTAFLPAYAFMCALRGFALLHVNFRGSTGFGEDALNSLPGNIGTQDVADVLQATRAACAAPGIDADRVGIMGGSHGGFLTCHMTAQYPEIFKAAATRNPVTNIPGMVTTTDIPDWCHVEALGLGKYDFGAFRPPTAAEVSRMWECSPAAHVSSAVAPTLIALGAKDRRVPQSQGLEWYHALRARGVPARLLVYPEDVHTIDKPASEADHWVNAALWLEEHL